VAGSFLFYRAVSLPATALCDSFLHVGAGFGKPEPVVVWRRTMKQVRPDRDVFRAQYEANRKIILATQTICGICGKPVDKTLKYPDPMSATVDHIVPIARHGHPSAPENLQLAHRCCNRAKSDHPPGEGIRNKNIISHSLPQSHDWRTF
jgi:5-methylcytosine-specific restriction endonuclease McrA